VGRLDGKVALISGAARGQGAATAALFAFEGCSVVLADILADQVQETAAKIGDDQVVAVGLDVTSEADWAAAVATALERFGALDVLVNNAGILRAGLPMILTSLEDYMATVNVNQVGVFLGMRAAAPAMVAAGGGSIINISSILGLEGMQATLPYVASKFAVRGMSKAAALELASARIRVNSIHPGFIDTDMLGPANLGFAFTDLYDVHEIPMGRMGTPDDVSRLSLFLASDDSSYCTGAEFVIDGGIMAGPYPPT
jgi:3alpha(or 20beta)-hydroxysteroid dehydrogenase